MSVTEWAERHLTIPPPQSPSPGPFRLDGREYMREPLDTFGNRRIHHCAIVAATQTAKTTTLMAGMAHQVVTTPTPLMVVLPNDLLARAWSETRWTPIVRASPALEVLVPKGAQRHDMKAAQQALGASIVTFVGSNSPANLASRPVRLLILDEVDKFAEQTESEGSAPALAMERTKAWSGYQVWQTSTPTRVEGAIWQSFMAGDMRRFNVPCPHCAKLVVFGWGSKFTLMPLTGNEAWMKWDPAAKRDDGTWDLDKVHASAHLECPHCQGRIRTEHRAKAVRQGVWVPTYDGSRDRRSWQVSSLYSPSLQCSFGNLAVRFLQQKYTVDGLQSFIQNELAEPFEDQNNRDERTEIVVTADGEGAQLGTNPVKYLTVDVQAREPNFWWVVREWSKEGHSRFVACGHADTWEDLAKLQADHGIPDYDVMIDCGFDTSTVFAQCLAHGKMLNQPGVVATHRGWNPARGRGGKDTAWVDPRTRSTKLWAIVPAPSGQKGVRLNSVFFNSEAFRDILSRLRKGETKMRWEVTPMAGARYWEHLDSYHRKGVMQGRRTVVVWVPRSFHRPDHLLDCEIMQAVFAAIRGRLTLAYAPSTQAQEVEMPT
jgi:hypothetical protein